MMKKVFLLLCLLATTTIATATDLWEGTHAVDWSNTLTIEATKFADAQVGQKIVVEFKDATGEVIELHSNGGMLPGTRYAHSLYADQHEMEVFITPGMLACLKEHGMEICGNAFNFTAIVLVKKETTGVHELSAYPSSNTSEVIYNLAGQKVQNPGKGLYIVNGKKVLR